MFAHVRQMFNENRSFIRRTIDIKCTTIEYINCKNNKWILIGIEMSVDFVDRSKQRRTVNRTIVDVEILSISRRTTRTMLRTRNKSFELNQFSCWFEEKKTKFCFTRKSFSLSSIGIIVSRIFCPKICARVFLIELAGVRVSSAFVGGWLSADEKTWRNCNCREIIANDWMLFKAWENSRFEWLCNSVRRTGKRLNKERTDTVVPI